MGRNHLGTAGLLEAARIGSAATVKVFQSAPGRASTKYILTF